METSTPKINAILFIVSAVPFLFGSIFFTYYTASLVYLNLTMEKAAAYRSVGMLIGAIVFPLAAIIFGFVSWFFLKRGMRGFRS